MRRDVSTPEAIAASPPDNNSDDTSDFGDFEAPPAPPTEAHLPTPQPLAPSPPAPSASTVTAAVDTSAEDRNNAQDDEDEEEEDDWGDFGEAEFQAAPPMQLQPPPTADVDNGTPMPLPVSSPAVASNNAAGGGEDDFGDFGDFEDVPTPVAIASAGIIGGIGVQGGMAHEEKADERQGDNEDWMQVRVCVLACRMGSCVGCHVGETVRGLSLCLLASHLSSCPLLLCVGGRCPPACRASRRRRGRSSTRRSRALPKVREGSGRWT